MRELVMLAQDYRPSFHTLVGKYVSEKMDGMRAIWVPWTRGLPIGAVPWANTARDVRDHICSGLWSRLGKPIQAPPLLLNKLPRQYMLDGELWSGRGKFSSTMSTCRKLVPVDSEWAGIRYMVFDVPTPSAFCSPGRVNGPMYKARLDSSMRPISDVLDRMMEFDEVLDIIESLQNDFLSWVEYKSAGDSIAGLMESVVEGGGEGLMLRNPRQVWSPTRCATLLKVKPELNGMGCVAGFNAGQGKYLGMVGSLIIKLPDGKIFNLSGMTDADRAPGRFSVGEMVRFNYFELTSAGVPRFAQYRPLEAAHD